MIVQSFAAAKRCAGVIAPDDCLGPEQSRQDTPARGMGFGGRPCRRMAESAPTVQEERRATRVPLPSKSRSQSRLPEAGRGPGRRRVAGRKAPPGAHARSPDDHSSDRLRSEILAAATRSAASRVPAATSIVSVRIVTVQKRGNIIPPSVRRLAHRGVPARAPPPARSAVRARLAFARTRRGVRGGRLPCGRSRAGPAEVQVLLACFDDRPRGLVAHRGRTLNRPLIRGSR